MVKNFKFFPNVDFDSSKEASWGTECNAKNHKSLLNTFTDKIKKKHQNIGIFWKSLHFWRFFLVFSAMVLGKDLLSFVSRSVPQDASFELSTSTLRKKIQIFHLKAGPFDLGGGQNKLVRIYFILPMKKTISEIPRVNALQKQSAWHSSSFLVYMATTII